MAKAQAVVTVAAEAVVARANAPKVVVTAVEMAVALAAVTAAVLHVTTIAMVNSSLRVHKAPARPRAKAVDVGPEWANSSQPVLRMNPVRPAHQPASQIRCAPASI